MKPEEAIPAHSVGLPKDFNVSLPMLRSLRQTKPWARLISLLGFAAAVFAVVGAVRNLLLLTEAVERPALGIVSGLVSLAGGLLYFLPSLLLYRYASSIGRLLDGGGQREMEAALARQKSFWKCAGVLALILLVITVLGILAAIAIPYCVNVSCG